MAGLSIVLEGQKSGGSSSSSSNTVTNKKNPQVINKATMIANKPSSLSSSSSSSYLSSSDRNSSFKVLPFLEQCFLCGQKLLPGKDIYMYKGDTAFCSVECRCRQIIMDEEDTLRIENCSFAAMKPTSAAVSSSSSASAPPSSAASRQYRKSTRNRAGGFAY